MTQTQCYIGRFAPSPSGPLHFGSLVAALGSWLDARHHNGQWLLRIEDIDPPREVAGASEAIILSLQRHGLRWDGDVVWQRARARQYEQTLDQLQRQGLLYACLCSRRAVREFKRSNQTTPATQQTCPGDCRSEQYPFDQNALRLRTSDTELRYTDILQGAMVENIQRTHGDFIVRRRGGLHAYQLAVVVDDADQNISTVVRGNDLLDSTGRQILLQQLLDYPTPQYLHLPVAVDERGVKLSKQTGAAPLDDAQPLRNLQAAWRFLGQQPATRQFSTVDHFLEYASSAWSRSQLLNQQNLARRQHNS